MAPLPVLSTANPPRSRAGVTFALHAYRIGIFVAILVAIHLQHRWYTAQQRGSQATPLTVEQVRQHFPDAASVGAWDPEHGGQQVLDSEEQSLGFVVQTSPEADKIIGFSGPSNTLLAFGPDNRIVGMSILRSGDTHEHTQDVIGNEEFMTALVGQSWQEASQPTIDAVSGATLTSLAIIEGIAKRLGGVNPSSRFPDPVSLAEVQPFFPEANQLEPNSEQPSLIRVLNAQATLLGNVTRTSPHTDSMIGYQGPTDTLIALDATGVVIGAAIRRSYDNEPYVRYVKEDEYFFNIFKGFTLAEIASIDMVEAGIEGVSGATKTSTTVAESLIQAAKDIVREPPRKERVASFWSTLTLRDYGTAAVVLIGLTIALTHLRGNRKLRVAFQVVLVVYLGFVNADMVSQALLVGWAQNGVAWRLAPALVLLTVAALACPIFTGRQVYCTHLCPFGSLQDWTRRVSLRKKMPRWLERSLRLVPPLLLLVVVLVATLHLKVSLVGIEPFDAFVFRIAGWATLTVAIVGLTASLFVPMAYCHYGCPTGAMLGFLRLSSASGEFTRRDAYATLLAALALGIGMM